MKNKEQRDMEKMIREFAVDAKRRAYLAERLKGGRGLCLETTREIHAFLRDVEFTLRTMREFVP